MIAAFLGRLGFPLSTEARQIGCLDGLRGLLHRRSALVLGERSFGIYLLHGILLDILLVDTGALGTMTASHLSLMLPVAAILAALITPVTYLLVERPAIRHGKAFAAWVAATWIKVGFGPVDMAS